MIVPTKPKPPVPPVTQVTRAIQRHTEALTWLACILIGFALGRL
jgi:hypothetical protein